MVWHTTIYPNPCFRIHCCVSDYETQGFHVACIHFDAFGAQMERSHLPFVDKLHWCWIRSRSCAWGKCLLSPLGSNSIPFNSKSTKLRSPWHPHRMSTTLPLAWLIDTQALMLFAALTSTSRSSICWSRSSRRSRIRTPRCPSENGKQQWRLGGISCAIWPEPSIFVCDSLKRTHRKAICTFEDIQLCICFHKREALSFHYFWKSKWEPWEVSRGSFEDIQLCICFHRHC